jgi:hypothetical protein
VPSGGFVGVAACAVAGLVCSSSASASLHVSLRPSVVAVGGRVTVRVEGWQGSRLEVALDGASDRDGHLLGWRAARRWGSSWTAPLPRPALRGIYPLLLRERPGGRVIRSRHWLLRVFRPHASREPSFATPEEVIRWWVRTRTRGTVAALRRWRRPDFDKRDPRLHRLFVIAYNPPGRPGIANRLGMFLTAVRDGYDGRWRLLEATVQP